MGNSYAFGSQVGAPGGTVVGGSNNNPPPSSGRGNARRGRRRGGGVAPAENNVGQGIESIRVEMRRLQAQRSNLEQEIQNDYNAARQLASEASKCKGAECERKKKQGALKLRSKLMKEKSLVNLEKGIEQLEHQIATIEAAEVSLVMTRALKTAATTLTSVIVETGVDEVVELRGDIDENMARMDEINGALYGFDDEETANQFEDEMEAMMNEDLEDALDTIEIPIGGSLPITPVANTTTTTTTAITMNDPIATPTTQQSFILDPQYLHQMQQLQLQLQQQQLQQQQSYFMLPEFGNSLGPVTPTQPLPQPQYLQPHPQSTITATAPVMQPPVVQSTVSRGPLTSESMGF